MFGFNFDRRILYIIIGILALRRIMVYSTQEGALLALLLTIPGLLIAISFHEFAHAFAADKLGDDTPRRQGRLTLNPMAHLDPVGCFLLLFAGFGWGKPVMVNPNNYTRKTTMEKGDALVSIAGPLMNFFLAIVFTIILCVTLIYTHTEINIIGSAMYINASTEITQIIIQTIFYIISINIGLGVFNLLPLPPLDGSKVIRPLLPYNVKAWFAKNEMLFYVIFLVLWMTGIAGMIISPIISTLNTGILKLGLSIFGI